MKEQLNPYDEICIYLNKIIYKFLFITGLRNQLKIFKEWESPHKIDTLMEASYFLKLVKYSFMSQLLIELCKLLSSEEEKSLIKFLKFAKSQSNAIEPKEFIKLENKRLQINSEEYDQLISLQLRDIKSHKTLIQNIIGRRNKILAHADKEYFYDDSRIENDFPIDMDGVDDLIKTIDNIIRAHHSCLFHSDVDLEVKSTGNLDRLLIYTRAFKRVWEDKKLINLGVKPYVYRLDEYSQE